VLQRRYNPEGKSRLNIVPGLLAVILTMTMVMMTALAVTRERERGTMENLLAMPVRPLEVMIGKITPYIAIGAVQVTVILLVSWLLFGVGVKGSFMLFCLGTALFITAHELTVSKVEGSGPGKVQSYGGITCLYGCTSTTSLIKEGTAVTVKQTPAKHFHFAAWSGDCAGTGACELTMGEDHEVSASFEEDPKFALDLIKSGSGQGIVKSHPSGVLCGYACHTLTASFYEGEEVLLEVSAIGKGSAFKGWSGGGCSGTGTCAVTMSEAKSIEAEFR